MGSGGSGNFTDYPGSKGGKPNGGKKGGGGGGGGGKPEEPNKCADPINDLALEDVATSPYFTKHNAVPPVKTKVRIRKKLVSGRIAVETVSDGEVVGNIPTMYNYLRKCLEKGWTYDGQVVDSSAGKLPKVKVSLVPKQ